MYFDFSVLGDSIETFHPVRWAIVVAIVLPALACAGFVVARLSGGNSGRWMQALRYVLAAELLALIVLGAIGYIYEQRARAQDARLYHPPGRLVEMGGYRLHLNCMGEGGPTVVLEYGLEGSYLDWYRVQPEIAKFARVCSYDRGGYGWSDTSPKDRVPSAMAEELHSLLRAAGEKPPFIVVGHSYGALITETFAYKFSQETAGAVLVDGITPRGAPWFPLSYKLWLRSMQWTAPFGLPRWRGWCGGARAKELRGEAEAANCRSRVYAAYYRERAQLALAADDMRPITNLRDVRLVVISRDPAVTQEAEAGSHAREQEELTTLSSNGRLVIAKGSGHDVPGMRPDVIVDAVRELVKAPGLAGSRRSP